MARSTFRIVLWGGAVALLLLSALGAYHLWPRELELLPSPHLPECLLGDNRMQVRLSQGELVAEAGDYEDELLAYLHFEYLSTLPVLSRHEVMLISRELGNRPGYRLFLRPGDDLLDAVPLLAGLAVAGHIPGVRIQVVPPDVLLNKQQQTRVFVAAYHLPVRRKLETLSQPELIDLLERFILFKSRTDPRVRKGIESAPIVPSGEEARQLAADIIAVADFYSLPLDFFLGIGAMENNYMNAPGDQEHAVWKRRAQSGDIVLRRRPDRVLVLNSSTGVWQITRETLRYSHRLYLKDTRDYHLLSERLRPPTKLTLDEIEPGVLTTYAGLLFRHLLDFFDGDVGKAIGAYNGGMRNPNMEYEEAVRVAAKYARRVLEQATALNGQAVSEIQFFAPARSGK